MDDRTDCRYDFRCHDCGRFVSFGTPWWYTPYGRAYDTEPPEDRLFCRDCGPKVDWESLRKVVWRCCDGTGVKDE